MQFCFKDKDRYEKSCVTCFKHFTTNLEHQKNCSKECSKKYSKEYLKNKIKSNDDYYPYLKIRFEIFKRDNFKCAYCGRSADDRVLLVVEHIKPISSGGNSNIENLITSCNECNAGKLDFLLSKRHEEKFKNKVKEHHEFNKRFEEKWNYQMEVIQRHRSKLANDSYVGEGSLPPECDTSTTA